MGLSKYLPKYLIKTEAKILNPSLICNKKFKQMANTIYQDSITNLETFLFIIARAPRKGKGTLKGKKSDFYSFNALLKQEFKMY